LGGSYASTSGSCTCTRHAPTAKQIITAIMDHDTVKTATGPAKKIDCADKHGAL
jgi:hypothetical protein